jgi:hypothetical protein
VTLSGVTAGTGYVIIVDGLFESGSYNLSIEPL